ncbi:MAG: hypothetical protein F6K26_31070 [Moorea sp. SIO2I5]|nr:hypothetical protein [Moorena sp. SIO2I5]
MQRGLGEAARSWGGSAFTRGFPPLALCRGLPHSRFAVVSPTRAWDQEVRFIFVQVLSTTHSDV